MFVLSPETTAWWPVTWDAVAEDGTVYTASCEVRFARIDRHEVNRLLNLDGLSAPAEAALGDAAADVSVIRRIARDWRGIVDEAGKPLAFTDEALALFLCDPPRSVAIVGAYIGFMAAPRQVREKNSAASPVAGPEAGNRESPTPSAAD